MSGTALTTVSPSRVRMRRSVVCVAGCCGPKFSVHRYSLSSPAGAAVWSSSPGTLALRGGDDGEVVPLAVAAQRVVLAQRVAGELLRQEDAAQVGVALEDDAVHVVDLALEPVGPPPQRERRRQRQ